MAVLQEQSKDKDKNTSDTQTSKAMFANVRAGVTSFLDLGVRACSCGDGAITSKFQIINGDRFAMSLGLELGYQEVTQQTKYGDQSKSSLSSDGKQVEKLISSDVPIFISIDISPTFTTYFTPRYKHIATESSPVFGNASTTSSSRRFLGLSAGVLVRGTPGGFVELAYVGSPDTNSNNLNALELGFGIAVSPPKTAARATEKKQNAPL